MRHNFYYSNTVWILKSLKETHCFELQLSFDRPKWNKDGRDLEEGRIHVEMVKTFFSDAERGTNERPGAGNLFRSWSPCNFDVS